MSFRQKYLSSLSTYLMNMRIGNRKVQICKGKKIKPVTHKLELNLLFKNVCGVLSCIPVNNKTINYVFISMIVRWLRNRFVAVDPTWFYFGNRKFEV